MRCVLDALLVVFRLEVDFVAELELWLYDSLGIEFDFLVLVVLDLLRSACLVEVVHVFVPYFLVDRDDSVYVEIVFLVLVVLCIFTGVVHAFGVGLTDDVDLLDEDLDTVEIGDRGATHI